MGRRGPEPSFVDVFCPNKDCEDYGKINNENIRVMALIKLKIGLFINISVKNALKVLHLVPTQFYMI